MVMGAPGVGCGKGSIGRATDEDRRGAECPDPVRVRDERRPVMRTGLEAHEFAQLLPEAPIGATQHAGSLGVVFPGVGHSSCGQADRIGGRDTCQHGNADHNVVRSRTLLD